MTEQEKREKEGRKIWEIIKQHYNPVCTTCFEEKNECFVCAADAVCDYMISKMEEVRKETAKEISDFIENNYSYDLAKEIRKKFCGVEVDEW